MSKAGLPKTERFLVHVQGSFFGFQIFFQCTRKILLQEIDWGKKRGRSIRCRRKVSFWQGQRVGRLGAELHFQLPTHKGSPSTFPFSAKSMDPWQWNCPCPTEQKSETPETLLDMSKGSPPLDIATRSKIRKKQRPSLSQNKTYSSTRLKKERMKPCHRTRRFKWWRCSTSESGNHLSSSMRDSWLKQPWACPCCQSQTVTQACVTALASRTLCKR